MNNQNQNQNKPQEQLTDDEIANRFPKQLPTAYVMWLTVRSQFIDHMLSLGKLKNEDWEQFEKHKLDELKNLTF